MMQSSSSDNCVCHCNIKILDIFDPGLQLINNKLIMKNKLKQLLSKLKKFKVQSVLVLKYKKRNDHKVFHSSAKLTISGSSIEEAFKSMNIGLS